MAKKIFLLVVITSLFATGLFATGWHSVHAQTPEGTRYFSETGHNVRGDFLKYYESNPNAIFLFGYPITEEFTSKEGRKVQYFQRARFEFHPNLPEGQRVQLTPLGRHLYVSTGILSANSNLACRTFAETGFSVCFAFLEFFDQYGGVSQFGYPISGFEYHENKIVQYFEKTRLEWQPWRAEGQRVVVSDLGRMYFDRLGEDPALILPVKPIDATTSSIVKLQVRAFAWKAVTLASDSQLIFIILQDQNLQPVPNASCNAVVHWPNGSREPIPVLTNPNGIGIIPLAFTSQPYGTLIYTDVSCSHSGHEATTTTSFRIWY
jgi:hypothetical protein